MLFPICVFITVSLSLLYFFFLLSLFILLLPVFFLANKDIHKQNAVVYVIYLNIPQLCSSLTMRIHDLRLYSWLFVCILVCL